MNTLKNIMRKVLVAVLSLAMTFTVAPNAGVEVFADGETTYRTIYLGGSNAYYQAGNQDVDSFDVVLYANG